MTPMPTTYAPPAITLPWVPDLELIRTLTSHGMPLADAASGVLGGQMRVFATGFYFDVSAAGAGDKEARERVDYCRDMWDKMRKRETI